MLEHEFTNFVFDKHCIRHITLKLVDAHLHPFQKKLDNIIDSFRLVMMFNVAFNQII